MQRGLKKHRIVPYMDSVSYRKMCRWNSGFFYREAVLQKYDWFWRVDDDVFYFCSLRFDPFVMMTEKKKRYGFTIAMDEHMLTIRTLGKTVKQWAEDAGIEPKWSYEQFTKMGKKESDYNGCHFWTNFEIGKFDFFRSAEYNAYFQSLDKAGGFFYERWGDAPVHFLAIMYLLNPSRPIVNDGHTATKEGTQADEASRVSTTRHSDRDLLDADEAKELEGLTFKSAQAAEYPLECIEFDLRADWVDNDDRRSIKTILLYLNEGYAGGLTRFLDHRDDDIGLRYETTDFGATVAANADVVGVVPVTAGIGAVFDAKMLHEGTSLDDGVKWLLRADIVYERTERLYEPDSNRMKAIHLLNEAEYLEEAGRPDLAVRNYRAAYKMCPEIEFEAR
eukprot:gene14348-22011_t